MSTGMMNVEDVIKMLGNAGPRKLVEWLREERARAGAADAREAVLREAARNALQCCIDHELQEGEDPRLADLATALSTDGSEVLERLREIEDLKNLESILRDACREAGVQDEHYLVGTLKELRAERDRMLAALRRLVIMEPVTYADSFDGGRLFCLHCSADVPDGTPRPLPHDDNCPWILARSIPGVLGDKT